nr:sigma 54-interacting transcriptional regulator [Candidatus Krumholzibacteria bacterium]
RQLFSNIALGNVFRIKRDFKKARQHLHTAYGQAQKLQFPREEALALEFLGDVYRDERLFVDAERFYNRAMSIAQTIAPRGDIVMEVHRRLGEICLAEDDLKGAQDHLAKALKLAKAQEDRYEEAVILRVVAGVWETLGQAEECRRSIEESISILEEIGAKHELAISLMAAAEFAMGEIERGRPSLPVDVMLTRAWTKATRSLEKFLQVDISYWTRKSQLLVKKISALRQSQSATPPRARQGKAAEKMGAYQPANVIIHQSRSMKDLLQLCDMFSETDEPALIVGETGTGKELLAHRLHELSPRAGNDLVCVNVSAISESLFEREVFGHVRGAFTGADHDRIGLAEQANGGTLFLDEIGDLPLEVQPKLLRLLQDGTYFAVGDPVERRTDIRLVAATNADLNRKVQNGEFRSDLYYRLKILEMELPPLRERPEDILLLLRHFLGLNAGCPQDLTDYFDRDSLDHLERYEWPGNVREIAMVAARAHVEMKAKGSVEIILLRSNGGRIRITNDSGSILRQQPDKGPASSCAVERTRILMAIEECGGCRTKAAQQLDMSRATLYRHMMRLGLKGA